MDYYCAKSKTILVIDGNINNIEKKIVRYENIEAPVYKGDIVGVVQYSQDNKVIDEEFIYAACDVAKISYKYSVYSILNKLFMAK